MWAWIKAKWAAFLGWGNGELTAEEAAMKAEEEALLERFRARQSQTAAPKTKVGTMGLRPNVAPPSPGPAAGAPSGTPSGIAAPLPTPSPAPPPLPDNGGTQNS